MPYYVYVLYSETFEKYYYGHTGNLAERLRHYNLGDVNSSSRYKPWKIFAYKGFNSRKESFSFETKLKNCKRRVQNQNRNNL